MKTDRDVLVELLKGSRLRLDSEPIFLQVDAEICSVGLLGFRPHRYTLEPYPRTFQESLKHYQQMRGYTNESLSEQSTICRSTIDNYRRGIHTPCIENLAKLCKALNVSSVELLGF